MKGIKLSNYFKIINPEYVYLRLTPNNSIENKNTDRIAKSISTIFKGVAKHLKVEEGKLVRLYPFKRQFMIGTRYSFQTSEKVSYFIFIEKQSVEFYFIIPKNHLSLLREKIRDSWANVTIKEVDELPQFNEKATKYQMIYSKEDALSLSVDKRSSELLSANLNVIDVLESGDKVGIFYNFIPTNQFSWKAEYKNTIQKVRDGLPTDREKVSINFLFKFLITIVVEISDLLGEVTSGKASKKRGLTTDNMAQMERVIERMNKSVVSKSTYSKATDVILNTQIIILSECVDKLREINHAKSLSQSFEVINEEDGGNSLRAKYYSKKFNPNDYSINGAEINKISSGECQNFIALAGRKILERYDFIDKVNTQETKVPEDLRTGIMCVGTNTYRGIQQEAFLSTDREYQQLVLVLIGPTRAGKSILISNLARNSMENNECCIIFDFIENCELSMEIASVLPKDKVKVIECGDISKLQGLGYNEVGISKDTFIQYDNAKKQTTQLLTLINSVNADEKTLAPRMERYLTASSLITFIQGGNIKDVFDILVNHQIRAKFMQKIPSNQKENLSEYISALDELDEVDKKEGFVIGTKHSYISGILDRLQKLKANTYMELMLKKGTKDNINLIDEIQKPQLICLRMPESMFNTDAERDVYCTYWMTKLWLALQLRAEKFRDKGDRIKVNLFIDELYQVNHTEEFLTEKLSRLAKFRLKPIISCHYLNQIKGIRDELRSANASYMLLSGCDKQNYNELKEELQPYEMEDLLKLPRYHSLNLIKCKDGYAKFITKLPSPIKGV
ncbi:MAG: hypothetical protein A2Y34_04390 [Spirochaetes bacterium GWC1_27_15]|nr:MAG: hypothetical protein A2Y34_04390 [Spirochaetes bacterium GWC1_27_15]